MSDRLLVVNADDFGLTSGVDRAILRAGADGIVTSTSVLATGSALAGSVSDLRASALGIGAHLIAVGGAPPLLSAREVPSLVDGQGRFPRSWHAFVGRSGRRAVDPDDLEREFTAQIESLIGADLRLTHLDTHQNIHLWPSVARVVVRLARRYDIGFIRIPRTKGRSPLAMGVRVLSGRLTRRVTAAALPTTGATVGLDEAGALHETALHDAIGRLGASGVDAADIVCHPGEAGDAELEATGWGFAWADEVAALTSPATSEAVQAAGFRLGTYADVARAEARVRPGNHS
jgi:predicted glycoside hydrolase/deacetylase ChbG (UPF0249 family)